ncbi:MAG: EAL domain-containing protein, partial [Nitrospirota bacterium]|nr:EAL domain-containing protein [Nitrospirota bacterium]
GVDLPDQVRQTGLPVWINNIQDQAFSFGSHGTVQTKIHVAVAFPVKMGDHIQGVLAFFHRDQRGRDDELLHLFSAIGSQIGQFLERKQAEEALKESQGQLKQAQHMAQLGYWNLDLTTNAFRVSEEMSRLLGTTVEQFSGTYDEFLSRIHPNDQTERAQIIQDALTSRSSFSFEYRLVGQDSEERMVSELGEFVMDEFGRPMQITGVIQDVTDRKSKENQIHTLSHYDTLTNLPNRVMFQNLLEQALASSQRQEDNVALLLLNIDRFTRVNETLGHKTGDQLLQEIGKRLLRSIRRSDTLARQTDLGSATSISRYGGDEFMILLTNFKSLDNPAKVARRILSRLGQPFVIGTQEIFLTASIGISIFPNDGETEEILLRNAQISMQHAKDNGRNTYHYFSPSMNVSSFAKLTMENALYKALERNELVLYYQPQVDILRREIVGVEALMRWNHPERGLVPPTEFIPLAEESGLIKSIGEWALRAAGLQHQAWRDQGLPPIRIGVNLSSLQFRDQEMVSTIETVLRDGNFDPQYLELELTEGIVMRDAEETMLTLNYLKKLGIHLAIDDFGTGYSSLSYLRRFPLDKIKIDRAFIIDITTNVQDSSITKAIIALGHSLNLRVIAEGVETQDQFLHLEYLGCDEIQGFLFSPPVPPEQIPDLFRGQGSFSRLTTAGT